MYMLAFSETPQLVYVALVGEGGQLTVLDADRDVQLIFSEQRIQAFLPRVSFAMEGVSYEIGDFIVKVAPVTVQNQVKALMIEVDYRACALPEEQCTTLLEEFLGLLGVLSSYKEYKELMQAKLLKAPAQFSGVQSYINLCRSCLAG
mmetsp:Transcript_44489/g.72429  ORF Transcript_44489/g.72429 Transcript_44489/m.72429 type:complete len:147 (-) Transcript_44489:179-619(-)